MLFEKSDFHRHQPEILYEMFIMIRKNLSGSDILGDFFLFELFQKPVGVILDFLHILFVKITVYDMAQSVCVGL